MKSLRDWILIALAVALVAALLWPSPNQESPKDGPADASGDTAGAQGASDTDMPVALAPLAPEQHPFFPLEQGAVWRYVVTGPKDVLPSPDWTMRVVRPLRDGTAVLAWGFAKNLSEHEVRIEDDAVVVGGMPFSAPPHLAAQKIQAVSGMWLPPAASLHKDATWKLHTVRHFLYRSRDAKQRLIEEPAVATVIHRALAHGEEKVIVPAGIFLAQKVVWVSRLTVETESPKRTVLSPLTTNPYREETTWFVSGIGMVRRRIHYAAGSTDDIVFDLMSYRK